MYKPDAENGGIGHLIELLITDAAMDKLEIRISKSSTGHLTVETNSKFKLPKFKTTFWRHSVALFGKFGF